MVKKAKVKKRGVKPGTKRGSYKTKKQIKKRIMKLDDYAEKILKPAIDKQMNYEKFIITMGDALLDPGPAIGPVPTLSMVETLDAAIARLEIAVGNSTDRINSLIGKV